MSDKEVQTRDSILIKHNTLVSARYNLSPNECRAFTYLLYKIQRNREDNIKEKSCIISQEEFKKIINDKNKSSINGITSILKSLKKNDIYLKEKKGDKENYIWSEYSFISGFEFDDEFNSFKVVCAEKVYDTLMNHDYKNDGFYTPINLIIWFQFKLNSTQRIYELLRLWSNTKKAVNYTIDELREFMMLEDKYSQYRDFKKRIILPAIKELKEVGKLDIEIKENRVNRQVESIDFIVKDLDKRIYFDKSNETKTEFKKIEKITEANEFIAENKNKIANFYVPNKKLFTVKTLKDFIADFNSYDFKDTKNKQALQLAIMATLNKDDEEKIKVKSYNYFKITLMDKLNSIEPKLNDSIKKTKFHNFDETFTQYNKIELNNIIDKSQKEKFKDEVSVTVDINQDANKDIYNKAIKENWNLVSTLKNRAIKYAKDNGLYYPEELE